MGDMQSRAEYVTYAIRRVHALAGHRRIAVVGHSQGGMIMRWALRFWPDTRAMVGDVVGMAGTNHGSSVVNGLCVTPCAPSLWQQRDVSQWTAALNSGQETFPGIDYTEIYSRVDEFVQPNADDNGTSSLHGPGRITNVALQDVCPLDTSEHLLIGTTDNAAWALGLDALTHDGPADPSRLPAGVCTTAMPGLDPVTSPASLAQASARVVDELSLAPRSAAEPPLRCYATAAGCPDAATPTSATACRPARRIVLRLRGLPFRVTRVTLNGRTLRIRADRTVVVDVRGRPAGQVTVRLTGRTRAGAPKTLIRHYKTC